MTEPRGQYGADPNVPEPTPPTVPVDPAAYPPVAYPPVPVDPAAYPPPAYPTAPVDPYAATMPYSVPPGYPTNYPPVSAPPTPQPPTYQPGYAQPQTYPPVSAAPLPVPYAPPPASGYAGYGAPMADPAAPYGYDPATGRPLSDKSKIVAGLLQLLLGFFFTLGGVGRLYAGNTGIGVAQLACTVLAWASFICGVFLFVPLVVWFGIWVWFVVDGVIMLAGRPLDGQGRPLRA